MNNSETLQRATQAVLSLKNHTLDILTVAKPRDIQSAIELSKVVSKLSPIVGNTLESLVVQYLNTIHLWPQHYKWIRQDPDFPDVVLSGIPNPRPGLEIKAWFPLATEITARFRDSQTLLQDYNTKVVVICWLLEFVIAGRPKVIDVFVCDAIDVAKARDTHYHKPPDYIVLEPEDTDTRTKNLQQKNCNGYAFQGSATDYQKAQEVVRTWGQGGTLYHTDNKYQVHLRELTNHFPYRLDTNFAKIDRIALGSLETFKQGILNTTYIDRTVQQWVDAIRHSDVQAFARFIEPDTSSPVQ